MDRIVLLPHPLGPISDTNSPSRTENVTSSTARTGSPPRVTYTFDTRLTSTTLRVDTEVSAGEITAERHRDLRQVG